MIKCNATVCGVINRAATLRQAADGRRFVTFGMAVEVTATRGDVTPIHISVATDGVDVNLLYNGRRVAVEGLLSIKGGANRTIYFNLSAQKISLDCAEAQGINGQMQFRGTCCKDIVTPTDKTGKRFLRFSAYSTDKVGEEFYSVFVRFVQFGQVIPTFVVPKAKVEVQGSLRVSTFNGNVDLNCKIDSIQQYVKAPF